MDNNMYMGQLVGPFSANEELYDKVIEDAGTAILHIKHLGIQAEVSTIIFINGEEREIGKTGIYEIGNTEVTSLYFKEDMDKNTIIDYTIETLN